jgi:hypothetical protein
MMRIGFKIDSRMQRHQNVADRQHKLVPSKSELGTYSICLFVFGFKEYAPPFKTFQLMKNTNLLYPSMCASANGRIGGGYRYSGGGGRGVLLWLHESYLHLSTQQSGCCGTVRQFWGSVTFWCGSGAAYSYLLLMDTDPTSFFSG